MDLLYRLKVMTIRLPPLRERHHDIRALADHFISIVSQELERQITTVENSYYEALKAYDWPGNVRELRNIVEVSVVMAKGSVLRAEDARIGPSRESPESEFTVPPDMTFAELEMEILLQTLKRCHGNRTVAADKLRISRRTIQRRIQELGLPF